ncbi:MAG: pyruvate kinase [Myxococcales bacterium]|nr:pyruvate kinase [Myxococcales bacterium]
MLKFQPRRAKIVCTIGPASSTPEMIGALIEAGMNVARLNMSHGSHEDHTRVFEAIREASSARGVAVATLADLQGPKIRVGKIPAPGFDLVAGQPFVLTVDAKAPLEPGRVPVDYPEMAREVRPDDRILMDDGAFELRVIKVEGDDIHTEVITGGRLTARKGVNLPGVPLSLPSLTAKDEEDLKFALELGVDAVALSFVRRASDVAAVRALMEQAGRVVPIVAKIEKPEGVANLKEIVDTANGIMVARGDLGVEMGPEEVPMIQKRMIEMANRAGKLVITATQMLDSMIRNPRPTRAEASDVANAVLDGSDAVMLSGETASGAHPLEAVRTMDKIVRTTEREDRYWRENTDLDLGHTTNAIARAAVSCSRSLPDTKAIITYTISGGVARLVSDYRPRVPIIALTPNPATYQSLAMYWGVTPVQFTLSSAEGRSIFQDIDRLLLGQNLFVRGDRVVITLGYPLKDQKSVNLLKIHLVGESLPSAPAS